MITIPSVERDERTVVVENASYRWAYLFISFGLLVIVAYRSFMHHESPWDLLVLVVLGGGVGTAYQAFHRVLSRQWAAASLLALVVAAVLATLMVWLRG
jgi:tryptophan-rich sensory protein